LSVLLVDAIASYSTLITLLPISDTETIRSERDTLVQLAAANLYDATTSGVQAILPKAIGGISELLIPPADQTIPDEIVLSNSTDTNNPYQTGTNDGMTGETILIAGQGRVSVTNTAVTTDSPVYIAATSNTDNQTLYIASKKSGIFTVAIDESIDSDISFKWWIAN